jgi:hypothetical protein
MNSKLVRRFFTVTLLAGAAACESTASPPKPRAPAPEVAPVATPETPVPAPVPPAPPPPPAIGMADPFVRMSAEGIKAVDDGYKALRARRYAAAREAFQAVVAAYPDKPAARFAELRAAVLEGDFASVPDLWRELLARDFAGYAGRLDKGKEMAPLRASPQWSTVQAIRTEMRKAYTAGLTSGMMFVARTHLPAEPDLATETGEARLDLYQEAYHFDPATQRIRPLSNLDGRVVAIHPDVDYRQVIVLSARTLKKVAGGVAFSKPEVTVIALDSLAPVGPLPIDADVMALDMCFSSQGEPVWNLTVAGAAEPRALTLDATHTGLVALEEGCTDTVATTSVDPLGTEHHRPDPEGVSLSEDGLQLAGVDGERPLRAREIIRPGSFSWSPGRKRFVYTGSVDSCNPESNSLFVWDAGRKQSVRVGSAVASYETQWLDDEKLVYESGQGRAPRLTIHAFTPGAAGLTLKAPAGAGLYGLPTLPCTDKEIHALGL